jgi:type IV pilus assembly protein PilQ
MVNSAFVRGVFALGLAILVATAWNARPAHAVRHDIDPEGMPAIDIDVQGASVQSTLRMFSEFSGVNIIAGPEVDGEVTARIDGVPWLIALDTLLRTNGYGWEQDGDIIRVTTMEQLNTERLNEEVVERKREDFLPLTTGVVRVSYAKAGEMKAPLEILLTGRGRIETDERTNSLIVTDIHSRIERVREMAAILDFKTPQVEINAKLVDVDARSIRDLGIEWSVNGLNSGETFGNFEVDAGIPNPAGTIVAGLRGTDADLDVVIEMLERDDKAEIISNPRITTADNKEAKILVGKKIPLVISDEAGNAVTELTTIGVKLTVVPHINQDDRITLDLAPEVSDLSSQATVQGGIVIVTSEASTRVIVADGETAVIGGLIRTNESSVETGVPFLKDIPLPGYLFKSSNVVKEERELLIFVTPRIIRADDV